MKDQVLDFDFQAIVEAAQDIIVVTKAFPLDGSGPEIVYVNQAFTDLTGYSAQEVLGQTPRILQRKASRESTDLRKMKQSLQAGQPYSCEILNYAKDGTEYWLQLNIIPLKNKFGEATHFAAIERDVTKQKQYELHLQALAKKDKLTGLVNRLGFDEILEELCKAYQNSGSIFSLAVIDLNDFKQINDNKGHLVGDKALQYFAKLIEDHIRQNDIAIRFGGDEFCIIFNGAKLELAEVLMQRISSAADSAPVVLPDRSQLSIPFSAGITQITSADTAENIFSGKV